MATKKFAQMGTKKLQALLETASEEDAAAINAILETRNAAETAQSNAAETALSPEELAAVEAAENASEETETPKEEKKVGRKSSAVKLSAEELDAKTEECKQSLFHRVSVLIPGTAIRVGGTITGVLKDKRAMQVYYQIQTDACDDVESRKIYKKYDSQELTILDEVVESTKGQHAGAKSRVRTQKMNEEEWEQEKADILKVASQNVGKTVALDETTTGRVISLLVDKRSQGIYYRIEFTDAVGAKKACHKVVRHTKDELGCIEVLPVEGMAEQLDEEGQKINAEYADRQSREPRKTLTPQERVLKAEEELAKAQKSLEKAQETLEARKRALDNAKAELERSLNGQEAALAEEQKAEEQDPLA